MVGGRVPTRQSQLLCEAALWLAWPDTAGHTNSVTESINGLLKSFLHARQSFPSTDSLQAYLDLFVLWHNTRIFDRGKRQGRSPFQIAGVSTPANDWIDLLGF